MGVDAQRLELCHDLVAEDGCDRVFDPIRRLKAEREPFIAQKCAGDIRTYQPCSCALHEAKIVCVEHHAKCVLWTGGERGIGVGGDEVGGRQESGRSGL